MSCIARLAAAWWRIFVLLFQQVSEKNLVGPTDVHPVFVNVSTLSGNQLLSLLLPLSRSSTRSTAAADRSVPFCRLACCSASVQFVSTPRRAPAGLSLCCLLLAIAVVSVSVLRQSAPLFGRIVCFLGSLVLPVRLRDCVACVRCNGRPGSNSRSSSNLCSFALCTAGQHCPCPGMTHIPDCSTHGATARAAHHCCAAPLVNDCSTPLCCCRCDLQTAT